MELDPDWTSQIAKINAFYLSTVCHVCKIYQPMLKRCSGCKLYAYCSIDHQKYHWPDHKLFCKMVKEFLATDGKHRRHVFDIDHIAEKTASEWKQMKLDLAILWGILIGRDLTPGENQLWMYPRVCEICKYSQQDTLMDCQHCFSYSYCREHNKNEHNVKDCKLLRQCYDINLNFFVCKPNVGFNLCGFGDCMRLPRDMESFLSDFKFVLGNEQYVEILASEFISPMLTVLYALEKCESVVERQFGKESCVVHIVGAARYEQNLPWDVLCELVFHWIRNLKQLTIILIGPELDESLILQKTTLCSDCIQKEYRIHVERDLYHDYVNSSTPDLIAAFNCGLHEYQGTEKDTWQNSIDTLFMHSNIPLVLTSYTREEAQLDFARLTTNADFKTVVKHAENPFKDLRPARDWDMRDSPCFYKNNYLTILQTC